MTIIEALLSSLSSTPLKGDEVHDIEALVRDYAISLLDVNSEDIVSSSTIKWKTNYSNMALAMRSFIGCGAITGSCALKIYKLLNRQPSDLDIVCDKNNIGIQKIIHQFKSEKSKDKEYMDVDDNNRIIRLKMFDIDVDIFNLSDFKYRVINDIMVQDPIEVLYQKLNILKKGFRDKDIEDLKSIFENIEKLKINNDQQISV